MSLRLYNTLTRRKEEFRPLDASNVRMYVCGPTVYDYAHIGNARPAIVFDVLFRLLRHTYGEDHVTYVRNITDVDDKINARAARDFPDLPLNEAIREVTAKTEAQYHADVAALGCLSPTVEPRATDHMDQMRAMIERLVEKEAAYVAEGHVLFNVSAMAEYGRLSGRSTDEMIAGARVDPAPYKRDPMDFVLWKPSGDGEPGWSSPCGIEGPGRPGWHIECSAMADAHLGPVFDIHGGGIDLTFPHHENERAQTCGAFGMTEMANVWMHNGFLQVEGEKMSKSLGNFITINDLLETDVFGGRKWHGSVLRLAMLMTHYRQPIDWTVKRLEESLRNLREWIGLTRDVEPDESVPPDFLAALCSDLNTPGAISVLHALQNSKNYSGLASALKLIGINPNTKEIPRALFMDVETAQFVISGHASSELVSQNDGRFEINGVKCSTEEFQKIEQLVEARNAARKAKDFAEADRIRDELAGMGVVLKDGPEGTTWELAR